MTAACVSATVGPVLVPGTTLNAAEVALRYPVAYARTLYVPATAPVKE